MRILTQRSLVWIFALSIIAAGSGCSDEKARAEAEQARQEVQRLAERLQASEDLLNRMYKDHVKLQGGDALDMTQEALDKANASHACCDANTERLDRMYQKIFLEGED